MGETSKVSSLEASFEQAWARSADGKLVVVRIDGQHLTLPALPRNSVDPNILTAMERMCPPDSMRRIAVIGDTAWAGRPETNFKIANECIPFFGLLMGLSCIGHAILIFSASQPLSLGCRNADVLIVDSVCIPALPENWQDQAEEIMRSPEIFLHDRASYKLVRRN
jgi:hypothetical protein